MAPTSLLSLCNTCELLTASNSCSNSVTILACLKRWSLDRGRKEEGGGGGGHGYRKISSSGADHRDAAKLGNEGQVVAERELKQLDHGCAWDDAR